MWCIEQAVLQQLLPYVHWVASSLPGVKLIYGLVN